MHCANTGAMHGCAEPGFRAWYSTSKNSKRKLPNSLEFVQTAEGHNVCVNTARANQLVQEALQSKAIKQVANHSEWSREIAIPCEQGRFDFGSSNVMMEVKMVSWLRSGIGVFPDAESVRATRHVRALHHCVQDGIRAILFFCVPHSGIERLTIASDIDSTYADAVHNAVSAGVEVLAYRWSVAPNEWTLDREIPFQLPN